MKRALICGISGQDGSYLAELLLAKGYEVWGSSRDGRGSSFSNLVKLGGRQRVLLESVSLTACRSVLQVVMKIQPDEVYNLAGQSSVGLSFQQPVETLESIAQATLNLLEAIRFTGQPIRLYNAGSSECFGDTNEPADETTQFRPRSPYAVAKAAAFWEVANYRDAYGLEGRSGILFNHESAIRTERFVTKKINATACRIARGSDEKLKLGNIQVLRDWGWAPEYVHAMWMMLQQESPDDYVIATGESHSLEEFISATFSSLGLNWKKHVEFDLRLFRPSDISEGRANPARAHSRLGWLAHYKMNDVVRMMVEAEQRHNQQTDPPQDA